MRKCEGRLRRTSTPYLKGEERGEMREKREEI